jgi:putative oxidoreductase
MVLSFIHLINHPVMNIAQRLERWGDAHHPKWLDIIRMVLGAFLIYKGVIFMQNMSDLTNLMSTKFPFSSFVIVLLGHYIAFAHIGGGFLMLIGLFTRFASAVQIPILLCAIIFINVSSELVKSFSSELFLSVLILLLLVYFLIAGNGAWSAKFTEEDKKTRHSGTAG